MSRRAKGKDATATLPQPRAQVVNAMRNIRPGQHQSARSDRKLTQNWNPLEQDADSDNLGDLSKLRARSHDANRSQPLAGGAILTQRRNVIGTGLTPHSRVDYETIGITKTAAEEWQRRCNERWWHHASGAGFDVRGRYSLGTLENLGFASVLLGGDVLLVRRWKPRPLRFSYGTCIALYEAHRIATPPGKLESATLKHGVEMDADGQPVAFWVCNVATDDIRSVSTDSYVRIPALAPDGTVQAILVSDPQRPGETRSVPYLSPVLERLRGLSEYMDNEVLASVLQSLITLYLETPDAGLDDSLGLGKKLDDSEQVDDEFPRIKLDKGANTVEGRPGEKLIPWQPTRPSATVQAFFEAAATEMAPVLGLSKGVILKHFDKSYSAARGELQEANRDYLARRALFIPQFSAIVRSWWLEEAVGLHGMAGVDPLSTLDAPGFFQSHIIRGAWSYCEWTGPVLTSLDPRKEVDAARLAIDTGLMSRQTAADRLYGLDAAVEHEQLVTENKKRKDAGLDEVPDFASASASKSESKSQTSVPGQPAPDEDEDDDDKEGDDDEE